MNGPSSHIFQAFTFPSYSTGPECSPRRHASYFRSIQAAPFSGWHELKNVPVIFITLRFIRFSLITLGRNLWRLCVT